ncbi:MAG: patatin-like phospholipase family protein [Hyphomicrobiales bacterium]|nr:patatin-like phospholipase family protein [Hyphomicrobiales bacterium]
MSTRATVNGMTLADLEALAAGAEQRVLRRGEVLVRQGDASDILYFVLSGRFVVHAEGRSGPLDEIAQGQTVGEVGFFAGLPRTATVMALRDSCVLSIPRARFDEIGGASPAIREAVILSLARRLARHAAPVAKGLPSIRTLAVVTAGGRAPSPVFVDLLRRVIGSTQRTMFLTRADVVTRFPQAALDDAAVSNWLNSLEGDYDFIFYLGDETLTDWTRMCVRQADALLLTATAGASRALNETEKFAFSVHASTARRLVLLHETRSETASGTPAWLTERDVFMHHHVALQDTADVARLLRFLSGRAVGFVASGGGAFGSAHLGVYKAFCEAGTNFDMLGGTSAGAAMAAALACGVEPERVDEGTHNIFVKSRAFRRPTWPRFGLIDHKGFDRALQAEYRDLTIEDLWRPYFAVSSNLSNHRVMVHRRGPVWHAVRASGSIPGLLPPFFTADGEMLVDGGLMDNVPLAPMQALKNGPNVVVALGVDARTTYAVDYAAIPGRSELLLSLLNPFARRRQPPVPGIFQVIMLSMLANRRTEIGLGEHDILVRPALPPDLKFTNWERHTEVFRGAHRNTAAWISARKAETDPKLLAILGAGT